MKRNMIGMAAGVTAIALLLSACGGSGSTPSIPETTSAGATPKAEAPKLSGEIKIDGSSTVFPITAAMAEEFVKLHRDVKIPVGISGSSGGFKKWVKGEIDINNSSRKIKESEIKAAEEGGFGHVEIPVAYDGISVVVSQENTWLQCITPEQLKKIWDKGSTVKKWSDVDASWPAEEIKLYGPGTDSGTMEYFTDHINGKAFQSRADYTASEDDNVLVTGVSGNRNGMGYFGYAYYVENRSKLRAVAIDAGQGCVEPSDETIGKLSYPISRFIYIYPTKKSLERPEVKEFVTFYLKSAPEIVPQVGYTALSQQQYAESLSKIGK